MVLKPRREIKSLAIPSTFSICHSYVYHIPLWQNSQFLIFLKMDLNGCGSLQGMHLTNGHGSTRSTVLAQLKSPGKVPFIQ